MRPLAAHDHAGGSGARALIGRVRGVSRGSLGARVAGNAGLLMAERVVRMVIAFGVTLAVARYLGVSDFGLLSYAISVALIAEVVGGLGLSEIVVRDLVRHPEDEARIVGTALVLSLGGCVLAAAGAVGLAWAMGEDARALAVLAVMAAGVPFRALTILDRPFQARMQARYSVSARLAGLLASSGARIVLIVAGAPLVAIAAAQALEAAVAAVAFAAIYRRTALPLRSLRVARDRAAGLLRESWPLAISAVAAIVYLRIDQVMLRQMTSEADLGAYAAAARLSEIWYFVPVAFGTALYPTLVATRDNRAEHDRHVQEALNLAAWSAIALAAGGTLVAGLVVRLLYGGSFAAAGDILRLHIWAGPFIFMSAIGGRSLIARGLQRFEATRHILGAPLNIALNLVLIPMHGAAGAALATLISYAVVSYGIVLAYPPTRHLGVLMTRALLLPATWLRGRRSARASR